MTILWSILFSERPLLLSFVVPEGRSGRIDAWHLDHQNSFPHIAFGIPPWVF